jgi:GGDEF domain-containing protein
MAHQLSKYDETMSSLHDAQQRASQLCIFTIVVIATLGLGIAALAWPSVPTSSGAPFGRLLLGFGCLILLLGAYVFQKGREVGTAQRELFDEAYERAVSQAALVDPETMAFNRLFLEYVIAEEQRRMAIEGTPTTVLRVEVFQLVPKALHGVSPSAKSAVRHAADLLKRTFRGSDTIVRDNEKIFLMLLPATSAEQAHSALNRLIRNVDLWNLSYPSDFELVLSWRLTECITSQDLAEAVQRFRQQEASNLLLREYASEPHDADNMGRRSGELGEAGLRSTLSVAR